MNNCKLLIGILLILLCFIGCSTPYFIYEKALKKLQNNEISEDEFYDKFYHLYNKGQNYPRDTILVIKYEGRYVLEEFHSICMCTTYRTLKFFPDGIVIETSRMSDYPTYFNLQGVSSSSYCYSLSNNIVEIEHIIIKGCSIQNIIQTGKIRKDTISFYEGYYLNAPRFRNKIDEKYVYDSSLK